MIPQKTIKVSGTIHTIDKLNNENKRILLDCGGIVTIRDFILNECGNYKEGDKIIITIELNKDNIIYYKY